MKFSWWLTGGLLGLLYTLIAFGIGFYFYGPAGDPNAGFGTGLIIYYLNLPAALFGEAWTQLPLGWIPLGFSSYFFINLLLGAVVFDILEFLFKRQQYSFKIEKIILYIIFLLTFGFTSFALIIQPHLGCSSMIGQTAKDNCYYEKATDEHDSSLCDSMSNAQPLLKQQCYNFSFKQLPYPSGMFALPPPPS
jgi:hypothetical protein